MIKVFLETCRNMKVMKMKKTEICYFEPFTSSLQDLALKNSELNHCYWCWLCECRGSEECRRFSSIGDKLQYEACSNGERALVWGKELEKMNWEDVNWIFNEWFLMIWWMIVEPCWTLRLKIMMSLYRCISQLFWSAFSGSDAWKLGQKLVLKDSMNKLVMKLMVLDFLLNVYWSCYWDAKWDYYDG